MDLDLRRQTWEAILGHEWDDPWNQMSEIESDNGIAMDEFVKFCKARSVHWEIGSDMQHEGKFTCMIAALDIDLCCETIAEVICRAIIEAAKAVK